MIDSITRFAMAHREIGLAAGELPAARGYPPSTMSALPQLLERAGTSDRGTITAIYTVLVDGDDMDEPVADAVRGIVDGHIVLSRTLANSGHFPAIDVLASVSRLSGVVYNDTTAEIARRGRQLLAEYASVKDLIDVGAYVKAQTRPQMPPSPQNQTSTTSFGKPVTNGSHPTTPGHNSQQSRRQPPHEQQIRTNLPNPSTQSP